MCARRASRISARPELAAEACLSRSSEDGGVGMLSSRMRRGRCRPGAGPRRAAPDEVARGARGRGVGLFVLAATRLVRAATRRGAAERRRLAGFRAGRGRWAEAFLARAVDFRALAFRVPDLRRAPALGVALVLRLAMLGSLLAVWTTESRFASGRRTPPGGAIEKRVSGTLTVYR